MSPWSIDVTGTWRHFGSTKNDNPNEELETKLETINYFDLSAVWYASETVDVRLSVLNIFGEYQPVFSGAGPALGNGNTYPTVYDTGTAMFAAVKLNF